MTLIVATKGGTALLATLKRLPKKTLRAKINAENTTATALRKESYTIVSSTYNIKEARLKKDSRGRKTTFVKRSKGTDRGSTITYKGGLTAKYGDRIGAHHFKSDKSTKNKKAKGWMPSIRIKRGGASEQIERGFYGVGSLKGSGIFQRNEHNRKITRRTGPSIKQMMVDKTVQKKVTIIAQPLFMRHLIRAIHKQFIKV